MSRKYRYVLIAVIVAGAALFLAYKRMKRLSSRQLSAYGVMTGNSFT